MAWIESHQELARHPKTKKLSRLLEASLPTVIGHLHMLWWWAMDYAEYGNLSKYDAYDIADAVVWEGDAELLLKSLIAAGFLDETENGLVIHDWMTYIGKLLDKREADRERKRNAKGNRKDTQSIPTEFQRNSDGTPQASDRIPHVTVPKPYPTVPNQTVPNQDTPLTPRGEAPGGAEGVAVEAVVVQNSQKTSRKKAESTLVHEVFQQYAANHDETGKLLEALNDYTKMRNLMKKPLTERSARDLCRDLDKFGAQGYWSISLLEEAIKKNWLSVYPPRQTINGTARGQPQQDYFDLAAELEEAERRSANDDSRSPENPWSD